MIQKYFTPKLIAISISISVVYGCNKPKEKSTLSVGVVNPTEKEVVSPPSPAPDKGSGELIEISDILIDLDSYLKRVEEVILKSDLPSEVKFRAILSLEESDSLSDEGSLDKTFSEIADDFFKPFLKSLPIGKKETIKLSVGIAEILSDLVKTAQDKDNQKSNSKEIEKSVLAKLISITAVSKSIPIEQIDSILSEIAVDHPILQIDDSTTFLEQVKANIEVIKETEVATEGDSIPQNTATESSTKNHFLLPELETTENTESFVLSIKEIPENSEDYLYSWEQTSGPSLVIINPESYSTAVNIANFTTETLVEFTVKITHIASGLEVVETTKVLIKATNDLPQIEVNPPSEVKATDTIVALKATATDPEGEELTYQWSQQSGPNIKISDPSQLETTFLTPNVIEAKELVLTFQAQDASGAISETKEITITIPKNTDINLNDSDSYTDKETVTLTLEAINASEVYITETSTCDDGGNWQTMSQNISFNLSRQAGIKKLYIKFKDTNRNESECFEKEIYYFGGKSIIGTSETGIPSHSVELTHTDQNGNFLVIFTQETNDGEVLYGNFYNGTTWSTPTRLSPDGIFDPYSFEVFSDSKGNTVIGWHQWETSGRLWVASFNGTTFTPGIRLSLDQDFTADGPLFAEHSSGKIIAIWRHTIGSSDRIWANTFDGTNWGTPGMIDTVDEDARNYSLATDDFGTVSAIWRQYNGTYYDLWGSTYNGTTWSAAAKIETDDSGDVANPFLVKTGTGNLMAIWRQSDGTRYNLWTSIKDNASSWSIPFLVENDNTGDVGGVGAYDFPAGKTTLIWRQRGAAAFDDIWARTFDGSAWGTASKIDVEDAGHAAIPSVTFSVENSILLAAWQQHDGTRSNMWSAQFNGNNWLTGQKIETSDTGNAIRLTLSMNQEGKAIASFVIDDGSGVDDAWANYFDGTGWSGAVKFGSGIGNVSNIFSLTTTSGELLTYWIERNSANTADDLKAASYANSSWSGAVQLNSLENSSVQRITSEPTADGGAIIGWRQMNDGFYQMFAKKVKNQIWSATHTVNESGLGHSWNESIHTLANGETIAIYHQGVGSEEQLWGKNIDFCLPPDC